MNRVLYIASVVVTTLVPSTVGFFWHHRTHNSLLGGLYSYIHQPDAACDLIKEYAELKSIRSTHPCTSNTQIWVPLNTLREKNSDCFHKLVKMLADSPSVNQCSCQGTYFSSQHNFVKVGGWTHDNYVPCLSSQGCKDLADLFYSSMTTEVPCQTHEHMWQYLKDAGTVYYQDTLEFAVEHLAATFKLATMNTCQCHKGTASQASLGPGKVTIPTSVSRPVTNHVMKSATPPHEKVSATPFHH